MSDNQGAAVYDFIHPDHKLKTDWPVVNQIHRHLETLLCERVSARFQVSMKHAGCEVSARKFQDVLGEFGPAIISHEVDMPALQGSVWFFIDTSVVVALVDAYFGGTSSIKALEESRKLTPTELRVLGSFTEELLTSMTEVWAPVQPIDPVVAEVSFGHKQSQKKIEMVTICARLSAELNGQEISCHLLYPYALLEPLGRKLLSADRNTVSGSDQFRQSLYREIKACNVELRGVLAETQMTVEKLLELKPGDFIPLRDIEQVSFKTHETALFDAQVGNTNGRVSASFSRWHRQPGQSLI